ncbi:nucleoside recognition domain-containing protein [Desulfuromonas sp. AOP6]|uniref:nucleoside recognition domain-containing protein n=1 Tax=Desulfuromonas sp. AOP6 TaxID=1566351 RepID=UPI00126ABDD9|nr:nucleoside recognition domain-containing protein [Desulfuromonas sp. AOP6]BCA79441.1 nucleoside recognition protein [Desulfuromonas sp. AOP6]
MEALVPAVLGALKLALKLVIIIVPLVTLFEVLRYMPIFRRAGRAVDPLMRGMGLTRDAAVPLFTGIFLGIAYGAGIIIRVAQEKKLPKRELFLMGLFLATCHAVVEDTLIFVVIGGDAWIMLGVRVLIAVALTALLARLWKLRND